MWLQPLFAFIVSTDEYRCWFINHVAFSEYIINWTKYHNIKIKNRTFIFLTVYSQYQFAFVVSSQAEAAAASGSIWGQRSHESGGDSDGRKIIEMGVWQSGIQERQNYPSQGESRHKMGHRSEGDDNHTRFVGQPVWMKVNKRELKWIRVNESEHKWLQMNASDWKWLPVNTSEQGLIVCEYKRTSPDCM